MARLRQPLRQRSDASDSILRCREREWFRLQNVTTTRLHRFLILGPDLRITAGLSTFRPSCVHRFLISGPDLGIDASFAVSLAARRGGFAQSLRRRMVPPATSVAATTFRVRFYSSMPRKRMVSPAGRHYRAAALILDFRPRLGNRCKVFPVYALLFCGSGLVKASFRRPGPQNEISIAFAMLTP